MSPRSAEREVIEEVDVSQKYGERFISLPEQSQSKRLSDRQIGLLQEDEEKLSRLGLSFSVNVQGDVRLKSSNTVGAARVGSDRDWISLQVVPKVGNAAFLRMLEYASAGVSSSGTEVRADVEDAPTLDIVVYYFATSIREFLRDKRHRSYEYKESSGEGKIKGRILLGDYIRDSVAKVKPQVVPNRYVDFTVDNFANQVIAYSVHVAVQLAKTSTTQLSEQALSVLQECKRSLTGVTVRRVTTDEVRRFKLTRRGQKLARVLGLCELIIDNSSITLGKRQRVPFFSFNVDMSYIFENYVKALFARQFGGQFTGQQDRLSYPIGGFGKEIRLDGLYDDGRVAIVVEAKYKVVEGMEEREDEEGAPITVLKGSKLERQDLYQTIAYIGHQEVRADAGLLLYPAWEESEKAVEVYSEVAAFGWNGEGEEGTPIHPITISLSGNPDAVSAELRGEVDRLLSSLS